MLTPRYRQQDWYDYRGQDQTARSSSTGDHTITNNVLHDKNDSESKTRFQLQPLRTNILYSNGDHGFDHPILARQPSSLATWPTLTIGWHLSRTRLYGNNLTTVSCPTMDVKRVDEDPELEVAPERNGHLSATTISLQAHANRARRGRRRNGRLEGSNQGPSISARNTTNATRTL